jgi:hypothetical protein
MKYEMNPLIITLHSYTRRTELPLPRDKKVINSEGMVMELTMT